MTDNPPPQYVEYPRPNLTPNGDAARLENLAAGYYGLNTVFIVNVVLTFALRAAMSMGSLVFIGGAFVMFLAIAALSYPQNKKIGDGLGWGGVGPIAASVLMGINSALCCGIVGYLVMQQMAIAGMKKYGIKVGFFGPRKADIQAHVEQLRRDQPSSV